MNLKRATQKKHSGRAEFIAKFCLMQFSSSGGEQVQCCGHRTAVMPLQTFISGSSITLCAPCTHRSSPAEALINTLSQDEQGLLFGRQILFLLLGTKMSLGFRHKTFWGELCASGNFMSRNPLGDANCATERRWFWTLLEVMDLICLHPSFSHSCEWPQKIRILKSLDYFKCLLDVCEYMPGIERTLELFNWVFQYLKGPYKRAEKGLFARAWSDRTMGNDFILREGRFSITLTF